jgi:gas vesicle protein
MQQVKDGAKQAVQTAKEKGSEVAQEVTTQVKQAAGGISREVSQQVSSTINEAKSKIEQEASDQKGFLADQIEGVANALHQTGEGMRSSQGGQSNQLGSYADSAAEQLTGLSNYLREHDLNQILDDARGYARQQPEIFYMGALVAGFLAGRFFRSSAPQAPYGSGYDRGYGPNSGPGYNNPNYSDDYRRNYQGGYGGSFESGYSQPYGQAQGASYGQGYGPTYASASNVQHYPQTVPVNAPKGDAETDEVMNAQMATSWTPAEQALHARSDEE